VYLAEVGRPFAAALFRLIGGEANQVKDVAKEVDRAEQLSPSREPDLERWEERVEHDISEDTQIPDTQREAIILARIGPSVLRETFSTCLLKRLSTSASGPEYVPQPLTVEGVGLLQRALQKAIHGVSGI
jgi:hypothetical protein